MANKPDVIKPVKQEKLDYKVYQQIIDLIERDEFAQGDQLPPERELSQKLNVSQATLREVLTVMQVTGIVKTVSGHRTFIGRLSNPSAICLPLPQLGESPFVILEERKAVEPAIARSTENPLIILSQEMIYIYSDQPLWLTQMRHSSFSTPNRWQKSIHEHRVIFEAICDHNSELAASSVQAHLRRVERIMVQADLSAEVLVGDGPQN